jgi:NADH-quinone oxidoreductase subunit J
MLAAVILSATAMAVTRRNLVHAVLYLVISFFGSAMLFYLLGAPFLAALEVIIYAGAIMVLFLFIIMMIDVHHDPHRHGAPRAWLPAVVLILVGGAAGLLLLLRDPLGRASLSSAMASPKAFGLHVIQNHWLTVEVVSLLLLVALVGALYLGKLRGRPGEMNQEDES